MIYNFILLIGVFIIIFYIVTYPYSFKLEKKIQRVLKYEQVNYVENIDFGYETLSQKEILKTLIIEERELESQYVDEKMSYTLIKNKGFLDKELPVLILLHGLRDNTQDWLDRAKICENYLIMLKNNEIKPINIVLINSGYQGMSWYTNFYKDLKHQYETYIIDELIPKLKMEFPNSRFGIGGFSMGGYGAFKLGLKHLDIFKVIGSFSGAISIVRMSVNRRVIRLFNFLYIPKFIFSNEDKLQFLKVFSSWGYKILKEDPYTIIKKLDKKKIKDRYFYASVGEDDIESHLMLQQWIDTVGRMKKHKYNFIAYICKKETHTWEYVARDLKNFLKYFSEKINI